MTIVTAWFCFLVVNFTTYTRTVSGELWRVSISKNPMASIIHFVFNMAITVICCQDRLTMLVGLKLDHFLFVFVCYITLSFCFSVSNFTDNGCFSRSCGDITIFNMADFLPHVRHLEF